MSDEENWDVEEDDDGEGWGSDDLLSDGEDYIPPTISQKADESKDVDMTGGLSLIDVMEAAEKNKATGVDADEFLFKEDMFKKFMEEQRTKKYAGIFKTVYMTSQKFKKNWEVPLTKEQQLSEITRILEEICKDVPANANDSTSSNSDEKKDCSVCYNDFDSVKTINMKFEKCNHSGICRNCFQQYIKIRVRDEEVMPWIPCPTEDCDVYLTSKEIVNSGLEIPEMYCLAEVYLAKHLARQQDWVCCVNDSCSFGFVVGKDAPKEELNCAVCNMKQVVAPKKVEVDPEFEKMVKEGKVRNCPACEHPAIKEFGLCNVLQCANCAIWWNWNTRETGHNSRDLKNKARRNGTLWEAGELDYQRKLQKENLPAFIALLERNGIKYDPNYRRGW